MKMTDPAGLGYGNAAKIPHMNIPIWLCWYIQVRGQTELNSTREPTERARAEVPANPSIAPDFAKPCKKISRLEGKLYMGTKSCMDSRIWICACKRIFNLMGLVDVVRRQLDTWHL